MKKTLRVVTLSKEVIIYMILGFILLLPINFFYVYQNTNTWRVNRDHQEAKYQVAIIIDDFGNNQKGTEEMLNLGIPLTCAVIPFLEHSAEEAEKAYQLGHEVIIHLPMEPYHGDPRWLGERGITVNLSAEEVEQIVRAAIDHIPQAVGLNNHMGSKASEDKRIVSAIVEVLQANSMYIVDSKTSYKSVIKKVAAEKGVMVLERSVFLDNEKNKEKIKDQLRQLAQIAIKEQSAVAIGHVGPEGGLITARAIKEMEEEMKEMGIEFVKVSTLLRGHQ